MALIGDLLDVTRIEGGRLHFHNDYFPFDELVWEVVGDMQHTTERQTITTEGRTGETIYGDRDRIGQVLTNLLTNAIKYAPHSDRIVVKLTSDGKNVSFGVQDFGIGIATDAQPHIFERFYRETGRSGEAFPGLGLGLYIAREITQHHGGRMWVDSEPGRGSIFYVTLPIADSSKTQQQQADH